MKNKIEDIKKEIKETIFEIRINGQIVGTETAKTYTEALNKYRRNLTFNEE